MTVWRAQRPTERYVAELRSVRSEQVRRICWPAVRGLGLLLLGYTGIAVLVAWMLAKGHPNHLALRSLAPLGLATGTVLGVLLAGGAMAAAIFRRRGYLMSALAGMGLAIGVAVAAVGSMITGLR
ncbi:MAG: hypothetical protein J2P15_04750 [Micromonosporaceae bacterium]|nr:hypothetical protein [Micromonosporaceae bacterium]